MLVDAGPDARIAGAAIVPQLRRLGVERLDFLVLTHADGDHIGGAPTVMREFAVGTVVHADHDLSHPVDARGDGPGPRWRRGGAARQAR